MKVVLFPTASACVAALCAFSAQAQIPTNTQVQTGPPKINPDVLRDPKLPQLLALTTAEFQDGEATNGKKPTYSKSTTVSSGELFVTSLKGLAPVTVRWASPTLDNPSNKPVMISYQFSKEAAGATLLGTGSVPAKLDGKGGTFVLDQTVWKNVKWENGQAIPKPGTSEGVRVFLKITPMVDGKNAAPTSNALEMEAYYKEIG